MSSSLGSDDIETDSRVSGGGSVNAFTAAGAASLLLAARAGRRTLRRAFGRAGWESGVCESGVGGFCSGVRGGCFAMGHSSG
jgi:hypothetical protein